ncbi:MAG: HAMP domain-containing histidine kinase [Chloroflexi bacterium]|nr:HAMP domain-containing histidine kinase [Chloroflexota bacterium]
MVDHEPLHTALMLAKDLQLHTEGSMRNSLNEIVQLLNRALDGHGGASEGDSALASASGSEDGTNYTQFISFMVHEIRKPMTSIRGYADMLDKRVVGDLNDMQGQFVSTIRNNVISMERLVADISDLTKMRSGRIRAENKMDLAKNILMDVEKQVVELAAERSHELIFDVPDGLPLLNLDGNRAKQALVKLVENAIKYTPEGGHITVVARPVEGGLEVIVQDNGVGMTPEELDQLGELWFRGDDPLVTNSKGYGMGIPIAFECMRLVNGRLFFESVKGHGSTFGVFLPGMGE